MPKYIALTIGPIVKTLQSASSTGELWGASYIFSYMMKSIIREFRKERRFIIPFTKDDSLFDGKNGIGIFHDRFIFEACQDDFERLGKVVDSVLEGMADQTAALIEEEKIKIHQYFKQYFQIYYLEKELAADDNPILNLSDDLDAIELRSAFVPKEQENYLLKLLCNENIKKNFLMQDAREDRLGRFLSIPQIAAHALDVDCEHFSDTEGFYVQLESALNKSGKTGLLKKVHKYIAIVQADGDNLGNMIKTLQEGDYERFSKCLLNFSKLANQSIMDYGGFTIFAGGDDLLFFAPVIGKEENIFGLIDRISREFKEIFEKGFGDASGLSLSYGISMTFGKYPLYEALAQARELLGKAKKFERGNKKKNAVAFRVIKHSGQHFGTVFNKDSEAYEIFKGMLSRYPLEENFLKSLHNKLQNDLELVKLVMGDGLKLRNYFTNNFNEKIHKEGLIPEFLKNVQRLIMAVHNEAACGCKADEGMSGLTEDKLKQAMETVYSYLKFIKFMYEKGEEE